MAVPCQLVSALTMNADSGPLDQISLASHSWLIFTSASNTLFMVSHLTRGGIYFNLFNYLL